MSRFAPAATPTLGLALLLALAAPPAALALAEGGEFALLSTALKT